ncbi:hypothetical protein AMTRI_Chr02g223350 [Amborella trichopoda]
MNHACCIKHVSRIITSHLSAAQACVVHELKIICSHVSSKIYTGIHVTGCCNSAKLDGVHERDIFDCRKVHRNEELIRIFSQIQSKRKYN